jgi:hypothetical protein
MSLSREKYINVLENTYKLLYKLKFIDNMPNNMMDIYNDFNILNSLHNFVYKLKSSDYNLDKKYGMLKSIGIFTNLQISRILSPTKMVGGSTEFSTSDWIFFPLWTLENHEKYGPFMGIPIDFISVLLTSLDSVISTMLTALDSIRDPIVQTIMSVFSVGTAGIGLAITPVLVPIVNKTIDLLIHLVTHLIDVLNMFIHISRKNFGLAYLLLLEIIPPLNLLMEKATNYAVILNKSLTRTSKILDKGVEFMNNIDKT